MNKKSKRLSELEGEICIVNFGKKGSNEVLMFVCPICKSGHMIMVVWKPPTIHTSGAIWKKTGDNIENITIRPSINCDTEESTCKFHGWVKNGTVTW